MSTARFRLSWTFLANTRLGRYLYAVGGNETAARASGINVRIVKLFAYTLCGSLAGLAGVVLAAQIRRDEGAREVLAKHPGLKLLAHQTAEWDRAKAMALMENWIQAHGAKINAVFAQNDEMGMGAVIALEQAGLRDKVVVASVDAIADALQAVKEGRLDATVFQDARGQTGTALETAVNIVRKQPFKKEVFIPFRLVSRDNIAEFVK